MHSGNSDLQFYKNFRALKHTPRRSFVQIISSTSITATSHHANTSPAIIHYRRHRHAFQFSRKVEFKELTRHRGSWARLLGERGPSATRRRASTGRLTEKSRAESSEPLLSRAVPRRGGVQWPLIKEQVRSLVGRPLSASFASPAEVRAMQSPPKCEPGTVNSWLRGGCDSERGIVYAGRRFTRGI